MTDRDPRYTAEDGEFCTPRQNRIYGSLMFAALLLFCALVAYAIAYGMRTAEPPRTIHVEPDVMLPLALGPVSAPAALPPSEWCTDPHSCEPDPKLVRMLVRTVIHEAGLESPADADGITHVVLDRARKMGIEPLAALRAYASGVFASRRRDSSGWKVRVFGTVPEYMPPGWRSRARWDALGAPGVRMVQARVHGLLTGRVAFACTPDHWGAPTLRREHAGWREIPCVVDGRRALNAYWNVPRGRRARATR
jgi:hypothetical protein